MHTWLNAIGLVLSLVGSVLMFVFGVPAYPDKARAGTGALLLEADFPEERRRVYQADRIGKLGLGLLALGFALQFAAILCDA
jgi:hypothetical protein